MLDRRIDELGYFISIGTRSQLISTMRCRVTHHPDMGLAVAEQVVDDLTGIGTWLPVVRGADFKAYALQQGLIEWGVW